MKFGEFSSNTVSESYGVFQGKDVFKIILKVPKNSINDIKEYVQGLMRSNANVFSIQMIGEDQECRKYEILYFYSDKDNERDELVNVSLSEKDWFSIVAALDISVHLYTDLLVNNEIDDVSFLEVEEIGKEIKDQLANNIEL